jgi:minor extracellular protease Epr
MRTIIKRALTLCLVTLLFLSISLEKSSALDLAKPSNTKQSYSITATETGVNDTNWAYAKVGVDKLWEKGATGEGITIAILDTGVDIHNPNLYNSIVQGYNAITKTSGYDVIDDDNGHGSAIAGIIAAEKKKLGLTGVAYGAKIMPVKVLNEKGQGADKDIADGIRWAADHGANIINLSFGASQQEKVLDEALEYAAQKGCLIIAAAGNRYTKYTSEAEYDQPNILYPAAHPAVMAITATDINDELCPFSSAGPRAELAVPGKELFSYDLWQKNDKSKILSGTSYSTAFASAAAALLWSSYPTLKAAEIREVLTMTAADLGPTGRDSKYGFGRMDLEKAYEACQERLVYESKALVGLSGGILIVEGYPLLQSPAILEIEKGTFDLPASANVSLERYEENYFLPKNITPASEAFLVSWDNTLLNKPLKLSIKPLYQLKSNESYLIYKYCNTRWIPVIGGEYDYEQNLIEVMLREPGIYKAGIMTKMDYSFGQENPALVSYEIAREAFPQGADNVIIVNEKDSPGILLAITLSARYNAPVLLSNSSELTSEAQALLSFSGTKNIYIIGGQGVITASLEQELKQYGDIIRLGGRDRFETALNVAKHTIMKNQVAIVDYADNTHLLTSAAYAARNACPLLLSAKNKIDNNALKMIRTYSVPKVITIGSTDLSESFDNIEKNIIVKTNQSQDVFYEDLLRALISSYWYY